MSFFESFEYFWHSEDFEKSLNHTTPPRKVFEVRKKRVRNSNMVFTGKPLGVYR